MGWNGKQFFGVRVRLLLFCLVVTAENGFGGSDVPLDRSVGVEELLGHDGRKRHAERLANFKIDGRSYDWQTYSAWGKELAFDAKVAKPPTGPSPSKSLSAFYRCTHCHNFGPEDPVLTVQDPEIRAAWIEKEKSSSKSALFLAPGTTLWGAVNRESFYNDSYQIYHSLLAPGLKTMDPASLEDSTQVCCKYCSVGRFAKLWEIVSLMTYLWDCEVRLSDLNLPPAVEEAVLKTLTHPDSSPPDQVQAMREFLKRHYLVRAGDTAIPPPAFDEKGEQGPYPDKLMFEGDAALGAKLYKMACHQCHGPGKVYESEGADLVADPIRFFDVISHGTEQAKQPYMPMFTAQRLSRQQIADIQAYLEQLK